MPAVSVIVPTRNREAYLEKALGSLLDQSLPNSKFEIIVVDGSSARSRTRAVCEKYENITYINEPRLGVSPALNTGWKAAKGEIVVYLPDDAIASHDWLEKILESFSQGGSCIGGKSLPCWEGLRPAWLPDSLLWAVSILDYNMPRRVLNGTEFLFGLNMALKRDVLEKFGGFREDLSGGPFFGSASWRLLERIFLVLVLGRAYNSRLLPSMEDVDLQIRLDSCGVKRVYDPSLVVTHHVPTRRLSKAYFIKRAFAQGVAWSIREYQFKLGPSIRILRTQYMLRALLTSPKFVSGLFSTEVGRRLEQRCRWAERMGYFYVMWYMSRPD